MALNLNKTPVMNAEADKANHEIINPSISFDKRRPCAERSRRMVRKRIDLGICVLCKCPNPRKSQKCKPCTDKVVAANKRRKEALVNNIQCIRCGTPWSGDTLICPDCRIKINQKWKDKDLTKLCFRCAAPRDTNHKSCSICREEMRKDSGKRRSASHAKGFCVQCRTEEKGNNGKYCVTCALKTSARRWLEDSSRWMELKDLFKKQDGKCAYTDIPIFIGENASLDHKNPRSKGGANSIENLQWVDWDINRMKTDIPHDKFLAICHFISNKFSNSPPTPTTPPASPVQDAAWDSQ